MAEPQAQQQMDPQALAEHQAKTLWVGNVTPGMDEATLMQLFSSSPDQPTEVKVIRDRMTNQAAGYGFATFSTAEAAGRVLQTLNGQTAPGTQYTFRLNWSSTKPSERGPRGAPGGRMGGGGRMMGGMGGMGGMMGGYPGMGGMGGYGGGGRAGGMMGGRGGGGGGNQSATENTLFVGDLDPSVTEDGLRNAISSAFPSVQIAHVRIVSDQATGISKGYGFVRFNSEADMHTVHNGTGQQMIIAGKPARIKPAMHRQKQSGPMHGGYGGAPGMYPSPYGQPPMHGGMMMGMPNGAPMYPYGGYPPAAAYGQAPGYPPASYYGAPPTGGRSAPYK